MEALIDKPGPIEVKTVASADWVADLSGLINLKDSRAVQAGLTDHEEPIQIYTHLLRHPTQGFHMVDTGVSKRFVEDPNSSGVGWVARNFAKLDKCKFVKTPRRCQSAFIAGRMTVYPSVSILL